jgi:hypothetical protein
MFVPIGLNKECCSIVVVNYMEMMFLLCKIYSTASQKRPIINIVFVINDIL